MLLKTTCTRSYAFRDFAEKLDKFANFLKVALSSGNFLLSTELKKKKYKTWKSIFVLTHTIEMKDSFSFPIA